MVDRNRLSADLIAANPLYASEMQGRDERPILFIVTNSGEPIEKQSILDFLASKVAKWWLPDEIVFLKDLPHGATGKLQKFELRDEYANFYMEK